MADAKRDQNYVTTLLGVDIGDLTTPVQLAVDPANNRLLVSAIITAGGGSGGDGAILDGVDTGIKATVFNYTTSNPIATTLVDTNGDPVSVGGGTQYTEDAVASANPVGTAVNLIRQDTPSALVSADGDNVAQRGTNYGAAFTQIVTSSGSFVDTFGGGTQYTDGDADATPTGTVALGFDGANVQALATDASGNLQVDILTIPAVVVSATDLDIRNLDSATDSVTVTGTVAIFGSVAVTGTFFQATQPVSATDLDIRNLVFATDKVDVSGSTLGANSGVDIGDVTINNASIAVTGTFFQATQPVSAASLPLPTGASTETTLGTRLSESDFDSKTGALTETAPASDTASSGLNGRLQRIAQRITSLIAIIPASLGQKAMAASLAVVIASDQSTLPVKEARSSTPSQTSPSVTSASTSVLASNANRLGFTIYNEGAATCYLKLGATASTTSYSVQIASGGYYECPFNYTGAVDGITSSGTAQLRVTEIT